MFTDYINCAVNKTNLVNDSTLHVIGVVFNPVRYHSRYRIFREWETFMKGAANVKLHIVEIAFGDRHLEVTTKDDCSETSNLCLRTSHELWHKENMINLAVRHLLPLDWKYLAWIDTDVFFSNPNWAIETIHQLQHYPLIQPWSECMDLGAYGNALSMFRSFSMLAQRGVKQQTNPADPYPYGHSGFAWACTRLFWENVGGLMDFAILGSADHHMAWASIGGVQNSVHKKMNPNFGRLCQDWQERSLRLTHGHLSYVPGRIEHRFHGPKARRYYRDRWQIFIKHNFDPIRDLQRDEQGLYYIAGKPGLQEDIRQYMRARHEDSIEE